MAFIAPLAGLAVGGGLLGSIVTTVAGIGINLAIAYFFPQKIKGPRAESLKAQTSRYGEQLTRWHGAIRTAGAVIWLKADHIDEHVKTERQGKALGPEVTTYSYTATFAVAFAWNGPASGVTRIWADDKLIFDISAEALQHAIDNGGKGIGVAKGASITVYLGTDDQGPDPDIEADRGAGNVPAWPGIVYVVVKNLPLDEFGLRIPNMEGELLKQSESAYLSINVGAAGGSHRTDINGDAVALAANDGLGGILTLYSLPSGTVRKAIDLGFPPTGVIISSRNDVLVGNINADEVHVYDLATGAQKQVVTGVLQSLPKDNINCSCETSIGGVSYILMAREDKLSLLSNIGTGWSLGWSLDLAGKPQILSCGPDRFYWSTGNSTVLHHSAWDTTTISVADASFTLPVLGAVQGIRAIFYDDESDSVIVFGAKGNIYVYSADMGTLLRSISDGGWNASGIPDQLLSRRALGASNTLVFSAPEDHRIVEYRISDLTKLADYATTTWGFDAPGYLSGVSAGFGVIWQPLEGYLMFVPRLARTPVLLSEVLEAECGYAGLTADASAVTSGIYGYGDRAGTPPRGVVEDLTRVNFVDWAQIDGVQTFFPRQTASFRTLSIDDVGVALNAEPDPVSVTDEYPSALDMPEQIIITYPSYDAAYRIGAQAGTTKEDEKFNDEPSQADETGAPIKVRRKRALAFSTSQVLKDDDAAQVADVMFNSLLDAATVYKTTVGPKHMDLHPGQVVTLPLDEGRTAKAVLTKMSGDTVVEMEFRKRGDSFTSEAVGVQTPYVIDSLLGIADATPVLIDGHLLRGADNNDGFYTGVAVTSAGTFRSASIYRSEDGGSTYLQWAGFVNGMIRGIALDALPDRAHPAAWDRATAFNIAVPIGSAPASVSEDALLASETTNGFAVWNASVGDWEYIRAASVVDNMDGTWTLSTLLRGLKGTEFAMAGHAAGATVYHLDDQAMTRSLEGDRTLARIYVAVPTSTVFDSTGAVTFTNNGKGLRPWSPQLVSAVLDSGTGDWTFVFNRRDRLGQAWPESGPETPPMSESVEAYAINIYDGMGVLVNSYDASTETYTYTAADQTTDFGSPQTTLEFGLAQVSAIYGDGIELREAA
ncbi:MULTISPECIES: phage tail baseplate protein [Mesorhizobium]|uniref:GTA baseplate fiber-binding domain-containing protein n=1 Tax=Mesorhizobium TaxID=68287 RepID=UPI0010A96108|nr:MULTISPECIES: phage tail protein [Mesorhizobium]